MGYLRQMQNSFAGKLSLQQALRDLTNFVPGSLNLDWRSQLLPGHQLQRALEHAQQIMETLPYPAIVVTHTFQVQAANEFFLRLLELPPLDTLPQHQRSMMHFLFHLVFRARSTINAEARASWQKHVLSGIQLFKQQNALSQYDAWYQQSVQQWCDDIADFQEYWEKAREVTRQEVAPTKMVFARMATTGELLPIRVWHMLVSVSSKTYPAVSALLPVDEAARAVYASYRTFSFVDPDGYTITVHGAP